MFLTHARQRARLAASALLAAAALALTACGGDAEGQPDPTASPATSAAAQTPTPTPAATPSYKPASADGPAENVPLPKMPKEAKEKTHAGLEAFARHWYALLNYAYESGDAAPLKAITSGDCERCQMVYKGLEAQESSTWTIGGEVQIQQISTNFAADSNGIYQLPVQLKRMGATHYVDGEKHSTDAPGGLTLDLFMARYEKGEWTAQDVGVIKGP
ncbi:DUF6318 family protein [Arthrobacter mangrovi]|uniref:DUF6318 domain-containing protein n=1 Tax=Arthrobacter mangrovi TaxID=2966350 RepID=A0ABQ5MP21_9MICC|nr:DUF6318 family protein [Arthrobacter mangrovi]GLB65730.1 hypothetical protein AHIS1636_01690 [Arthrobacter mangrovi]